jgi:AcrR family transcriptional regulator
VERPLEDAGAANTRYDERRREIIRALRDCMVEKGYAATTLTDVARAVDMKPGHLFYYFKGKDAILIAFFEMAAARLREHVGALESLPFEERLDRFADFWFLEELRTPHELGTMLEFFGLSVHKKELHEIKLAFDRELKDWIRKHLLTDGPREHGDMARISSEAIYALLMGLLTAAYFDPDFGYARAHALFRLSLRQIAGLEAVYGGPK